MDNLEEMSRFLEKFNLPRVNQKEIEVMNNPVTSNEIEAVIKNFPENKSLGPEGFTGEFYQVFREELMPILLKLLQKIAGEGTLPNSFYEAPSPQYQNRTKTAQKKKPTITHQSEWLLSKSLQAINAGEGVEKREPYYTLSGNAN